MRANSRCNSALYLATIYRELCLQCVPKFGKEVSEVMWLRRFGWCGVVGHSVSVRPVLLIHNGSLVDLRALDFLELFPDMHLVTRTQ